MTVAPQKVKSKTKSKTRSTTKATKAAKATKAGAKKRTPTQLPHSLNELKERLVELIQSGNWQDFKQLVQESITAAPADIKSLVIDEIGGILQRFEKEKIAMEDLVANFLNQDLPKLQGFLWQQANELTHLQGKLEGLLTSFIGQPTKKSRKQTSRPKSTKRPARKRATAANDDEI